MKDYFLSFVIFRIVLCAALDVLRLRKKVEELFTIFIPTLFLQSMYSKFSIYLVLSPSSFENSIEIFLISRLTNSHLT